MFHIRLSLDTRIEQAIAILLRNQGAMMSDFSHLQQSLDALKAESATTVTLLQKLVDLKGSNDQATIDALADEASGILQTLTAADAAASDPAPAPAPAPTPDPTPAPDAPAADPAAAPAP